ncbi:hypothetical protein [Arthrobacter sp. Soil764]|uniref:hypothetical protein n=1 Tax=Arthrobacter sp. Soil764 TaxID=1736403 RepID=UPI0012E38C7F|nr:hypothetical protein [Arthrobacter sp. Soil764]
METRYSTDLSVAVDSLTNDPQQDQPENHTYGAALDIVLLAPAEERPGPSEGGPERQGTLAGDHNIYQLPEARRGQGQETLGKLPVNGYEKQSAKEAQCRESAKVRAVPTRR